MPLMIWTDDMTTFNVYVKTSDYRLCGIGWSLGRKKMIRSTWGERDCGIAIKEKGDVWLVRVEFDPLKGQLPQTYVVGWTKLFVAGIEEREVKLNPPGYKDETIIKMEEKDHMTVDQGMRVDLPASPDKTGQSDGTLHTERGTELASRESPIQERLLRPSELEEGTQSRGSPIQERLLKPSELEDRTVIKVSPIQKRLMDSPELTDKTDAGAQIQQKNPTNLDIARLADNQNDQADADLTGQSRADLIVPDGQNRNPDVLLTDVRRDNSMKKHDGDRMNFKTAEISDVVKTNLNWTDWFHRTVAGIGQAAGGFVSRIGAGLGNWSGRCARVQVVQELIVFPQGEETSDSKRVKRAFRPDPGVGGAFTQAMGKIKALRLEMKKNAGRDAELDWLGWLQQTLGSWKLGAVVVRGVTRQMLVLNAESKSSQPEQFPIKDWLAEDDSLDDEKTMDCDSIPTF
uniref:Uncharacterized protein n=1 Tax=Knipowitschia caucasica TaxID=637954 RepID=A0AAV2IYF5_KNICA